MSRLILRTAIVLSLLAICVAPNAAAWGPRAQQGITHVAIQEIQQEFPNIFRPGGVTGARYYEDVLRGARDGAKVLANVHPLNNQEEALQAVVSEMQLLRDVRPLGPSSYFAYRAGVLASLVSDLVVPYGLSWSEADLALQKKINTDIDKYLASQKVLVKKSKRQLIPSAATHFKKVRTFYAEDGVLIKDEYARGIGFNGLLKQSLPLYYQRAVDSVSNAWYTVLLPEAKLNLSPSSKSMMTWYFVNEVEYLLNIKKNMYRTEESYANFQEVNPGISQAYNRLGDIYYNFGTQEAVQRGVREWRIAFSLAGEDRKEAAEKLHDHYIQEGELYLLSAEEPGANDSDLPNALYAFQQAMQFLRGSEIAPLRIEESNIKIRKRKQRLDAMVALIAEGQELSQSAENLRMNGDSGQAILKYQQAIIVYGEVTDEFAKPLEQAQEGIRNTKKGIAATINEVFEFAREAIDRAEDLRADHKYDMALSEFKSVEIILQAVPDNVEKHHLDMKAQMIASAESKITNTLDDQEKWKARQEQEAAAANVGARQERSSRR